MIADQNGSGADLSGLVGARTPAFTIGTAAQLLGVSQAFLRQLGVNGLLDPQRSAGGHRRYSQHDLGLASQARVLVDEGLSMDAACRIVTLQVELAYARAEIAQLHQQLDAITDERKPAADPDTSADPDTGDR
ncbi:MerR family transcriptional regulator [Actinocatenispora sera]|uniref:MerR family transcriptional regulator n=1 Tax=Actinocatenispora sera TaxID=390989 RepID=A0A810KU55_9ACTN|nr:MerR family transcriptional regulator [Actinocatenispora sera]BCJ26690.1 MerR family transcriptional regulator [Actinocatenispora sera]